MIKKNQISFTAWCTWWQCKGGNASMKPDLVTRVVWSSVPEANTLVKVAADDVCAM